MKVGEGLFNCLTHRGGQMKPARAVLFAGVLLSLVALSHRAKCQTTIPLDPRATYILAHDDPGAINAVPISLASLGISAGNSISIQTQGDFSFCFPSGCPEISVSACGVFSANSTLLSPSQPHRVPGAIPPSGG